MIVDPFELPPMALTATATATTDDAPAPAATYVGPFDREAWPARLAAPVVSPGPEPRLHGYAVAGDLARFYGAIDVTWLVLRGELPTAAERAAFDVAMVLLAPVSVGEAPAHAAGEVDAGDGARHCCCWCSFCSCSVNGDSSCRH